MSSPEIARLQQNEGETHAAAAEVLIGAALYEPGKHIPAIRKTVTSVELWPMQTISAWQKLLELHDAHKVITPETLAAASGLDVDRLHKWRAHCSQKSITPDEVDANAGIVRELGRKLAAKAIGLALANPNGKSAAAMIEEANRALDKLLRITDETRTGSAQETGQELEEELSRPVDLNQLVQTGLGRIDEWTWEFRRRKATLLAAPYKQRKTTLMRNILLAAASRGSAVVAVLLEGDRRSFTADMVAMIADLLLLKGLVPGVPEDALCGEWLLNTRAWKHKTHVYNAIRRAFEIWKQLPITILDSDDHQREAATIRAKLARLALDGKCKLAAVDFAGLMQFAGDMNTYERAVAASEWMKAAANDLNIHVLMLAQLSEEGVSGGGGYSPKVKGGGDLPAAADQTIATSYDAEQEPKRLGAKLKLARNAQQGQGEMFVIRPASGLVVQIERTAMPIDVLTMDTLRGSRQDPIEELLPAKKKESKAA